VGDEHRYRDIFVPDSGALLDLKVFDVTANDWQALLNFLSTNYLVNYSEDGDPKPLPDYATISHVREQKGVSLEVLLPGFTVCSYFFLDDEIELDLLPEHVDSREKADAVFALMKGIAGLLRREVLLVPETSTSNPDELRKMAVCGCDPVRREIRYFDIPD
jgi:hypothetical protein